jgi:Uncharacterized protein conserved in bacteria (DUF2242)
MYGPCKVIVVAPYGMTTKLEIVVHKDKSTALERTCVAGAAIALLAGCASHHRPPPPQFSADAPFSRTFSGSGDAVCWSVKRALLSQGYMLDRPNDAGVLTGSRDEQPQPKLNVSIRLQTSCADNRNGTSIVFVTATREESQLQKMKQSTSVGVGPATLTMPSGSAQVLGTVRRETIRDPNFYNQFFKLVQGFVAQEQISQAPVAAGLGAGAAPAANGPASLQSELPSQAPPPPAQTPAAALPAPANQAPAPNQ